MLSIEQNLYIHFSCMLQDDVQRHWRQYLVQTGCVWQSMFATTNFITPEIDILLARMQQRKSETTLITRILWNCSRYMHLHRHGKCEKSEQSLPISLPLSYVWKKASKAPILRCGHSVGTVHRQQQFLRPSRAIVSRQIVHVSADSDAEPKG
jgi:hypothetical protein